LEQPLFKTLTWVVLTITFCIFKLLQFIIIKALMKNALIIGSAYLFATTAIEVTNCTTSSGAIMTASKGKVLDCTHQ